MGEWQLILCSRGKQPCTAQRCLFPTCHQSSHNMNIFPFAQLAIVEVPDKFSCKLSSIEGRYEWKWNIFLPHRDCVDGEWKHLDGEAEKLADCTFIKKPSPPLWLETEIQTHKIWCWFLLHVTVFKCHKIRQTFPTALLCFKVGIFDAGPLLLRSCCMN